VKSIKISKIMFVLVTDAEFDVRAREGPKQAVG
jgi:hypothetical protein